jgi:NTP pyrophosphatase (non-canonical NTP hydrolase)
MDGGGMSENQQSINRWIVETFGEAGSNFSVAARANQEMSELLMCLAVYDNDLKAVEEAADIVIVLFRLAERFGVDLHGEIDRKMQINRGRRWEVNNGHGYHIKDGAE